MRKRTRKSSTSVTTLATSRFMLRISTRNARSGILSSRAMLLSRKNLIPLLNVVPGFAPAKTKSSVHKKFHAVETWVAKTAASR
jgi:hypothetical protein